jgi:hypothetical protein
MHDGKGPMPKTQALMADKGATADQWFIHTPIWLVFIFPVYDSDV